MIQKPPESWDTRTLHNIDKDLGRIALKEDLAEERMGISEPLEVASATLSFYAVDKVYGLLGVMPLPVADNIVVDCRLNEARLFEATARLFINYEGCNEVLRSGTLWNSKNIASWAPDWTREHGRRDMLKPQRPYEADKGTTPVISFSPDGRLLTVRGVILDEVDGLGGVVDLDEGLPTTFEKAESGIKRHLRHPEHFTARTYRMRPQCALLSTGHWSAHEAGSSVRISRKAIQSRAYAGLCCFRFPVLSMTLWPYLRSALSRKDR